MPIADRRKTLALHSQRISRVLEALVLITLASKAVPFSLSSPLWYLRLCEDLVSLAPALLVAVFLLVLGRVFVDAPSDNLEAISRRAVGMARRWALVFLLVIPIQLACFTWLWFDSGQRMDIQLRSSQTQIEALRSRVQLTASEADLRQLLNQNGTGSPFPLVPGSLVAQKQQVTQAMEGDLVKLKATLNRRRNEALMAVVPAVLRVLIGAGILSACLRTIKRQLV